MKNFIFKSTDADLQKMFSILETLQKNIIYITYRVNAVLKSVKTMETNKGLQKQVDAYFEDDETSPQTDTGEQDTN